MERDREFFTGLRGQRDLFRWRIERDVDTADAAWGARLLHVRDRRHRAVGELHVVLRLVAFAEEIEHRDALLLAVRERCKRGVAPLDDERVIIAERRDRQVVHLFDRERLAFG